jgi:cytoskeletal protein RodZ
MSDPGLTNRLRQRSRRAGLAVGLSMALTIAVCVGSFAWIYAEADPFFADLVGSDAKATTSSRPTPTAEGTASGSRSAAGSAPTDEATEAPTEAPAHPTETPAPRPTQTPAEFRATHITNPNSRVNFRPEPNLNTEPIALLDPGTPVQALGDEQVDGDGNRWLRFRTEDGLEGWLREDAFAPI